MINYCPLESNIKAVVRFYNKFFDGLLPPVHTISKCLSCGIRKTLMLYGEQCIVEVFKEVKSLVIESKDARDYLYLRFIMTDHHVFTALLHDYFKRMKRKGGAA